MITVVRMIPCGPPEPCQCIQLSVAGGQVKATGSLSQEGEVVLAQRRG